MAFTGKAVYLDADMLVLGDVAELLRVKTTTGYTCCHEKRTDVSVIDCEWFRGKKWWPSIAQMKPTGWRVFEYLNLLLPQRAIAAKLPWAWNDCDGELFKTHPKTVKLVHYTTVPDGQPYRPYPSITYPPNYPFCKNEKAGHLWWDTYREALLADGSSDAMHLLQKAAVLQSS